MLIISELPRPAPSGRTVRRLTVAGRACDEGADGSELTETPQRTKEARSVGQRPETGDRGTCAHSQPSETARSENSLRWLSVLSSGIAGKRAWEETYLLPQVHPAVKLKVLR